jgi:uncharacterized protein (UPF0210 family)
MNNKILRTICYFTQNPSEETVKIVNGIAVTLTRFNYTIQTKRICSSNIDALKDLESTTTDKSYIFSVGTVSREHLAECVTKVFSAKNISFNIDITASLEKSDIDILLKIIRQRPSLTFNFAYVVNNVPSSPFFPSANFETEGFSIGLQPTDLSADCSSIEEWLEKTKTVWEELYSNFEENPQFLGIDSSIAPLFTGAGSFVGFIKRLYPIFSNTITTDMYVKITKFIKEKNPKPIGLCGLMFPCLEDFDLADEYEKGNFSIERNVFLSLHSGLGIDTYPIGINESPDRIMEILTLVRALSNKYTKPLSVRFVSDGKAKIGEKTDFKNQYLKDVVIKPL